MTNTESQRCVECHCLEGKGHLWHCSQATIEECREHIRYLQKVISQYNERKLNLLKTLNDWRGKFLVVKHENNQLRKNNDRLFAKLADTLKEKTYESE